MIKLFQLIQSPWTMASFKDHPVHWIQATNKFKQISMIKIISLIIRIYLEWKILWVQLIKHRLQQLILIFPNLIYKIQPPYLIPIYKIVLDAINNSSRRSQRNIPILYVTNKVQVKLTSISKLENPIIMQQLLHPMLISKVF